MIQHPWIGCLIFYCVFEWRRTSIVLSKSDRLSTPVRSYLRHFSSPCLDRLDPASSLSYLHYYCRLFHSLRSVVHLATRSCEGRRSATLDGHPHRVRPVIFRCGVLPLVVFLRSGSHCRWTFRWSVSPVPFRFASLPPE